MIVHAQYKYKYELISAYALRNDMVGTPLYLYHSTHRERVRTTSVQRPITQRTIEYCIIYITS